MSTDFRALCAELVDDYWPCHYQPELLDRARTALAQPEPEGVGDEELLRCYGLAKRNHCYEGPMDDWAKRAERAATVHGLRAVLTCYAHPAIKPVPVAERPWEREGWCDAEGRCWRFDPCDRGWWSYGPILPSDGDPAPFTYLLPHHALPVPQQPS